MFSGLQFEGGSHTQRDTRFLRPNMKEMYKEFSSPKRPQKVMSPSKTPETTAKNLRSKYNKLTSSKKLSPSALKQSTAKPIQVYEKNTGKGKKYSIVDFDQVEVTASQLSSPRASQDIIKERKLPTGDTPTFLHERSSDNFEVHNIIVDNSSIISQSYAIREQNNKSRNASPRDCLPFEGSFDLHQKMSPTPSKAQPLTKLGVLPKGYSIPQDMTED